MIGEDYLKIVIGLNDKDSFDTIPFFNIYEPLTKRLMIHAHDNNYGQGLINIYEYCKQREFINVDEIYLCVSAGETPDKFDIKFFLLKDGKIINITEEDIKNRFVEEPKLINIIKNSSDSFKRTLSILLKPLM